MSLFSKIFLFVVVGSGMIAFMADGLFGLATAWLLAGVVLYIIGENRDKF